MLIDFLYYIFAFNEGYYLSITSENDLFRKVLSYISQLIFVHIVGIKYYIFKHKLIS